MRGGYYRCASIPQVAAPPKPHAQIPQLHIATSFEWAHASWNNADIMVSRGGRIRREGRDVHHPLITTRTGEIPEQVSARADSAPILGYATLRTTRLTNLSRPKLTSSAPSSANVLGNGSRATLLTLAHCSESTNASSPTSASLICQSLPNLSISKYISASSLKLKTGSTSDPPWVKVSTSLWLSPCIASSHHAEWVRKVEETVGLLLKLAAIRFLLSPFHIQRSQCQVACACSRLGTGCLGCSASRRPYPIITRVIRFADRFVLEHELGSGGMARVFLGRDEVLDRPVAVKLLKPVHGDTDINDRFEREGRTAARLAHPNIVQVYDAGEAEFDGRETSYIVMEYIPGGDLKGLINSRGRLSGAELARLGEEVCAGLAHAHKRGVIHRDIKPHNILLDENGHAKVTDFGIARALDEATQATSTGAYLGTALYSSPEQLQGQKATPKSDVYSLGATLYQAATGVPPFSGSTPLEIASQHVSKTPVPCAGATQAHPAAPVTVPTRAEQAQVPPPGDRAGGAVRRDRKQRRMGLLAVLALLAVFAVIVALAAPELFKGGGGIGSNNAVQNNAQAGGNAGGSDERSGGESGGDQGSQSSGGNQQGASSSASADASASYRSAAAGPADVLGRGEFTARAAEQTVEQFYTTTSEGDYDRSARLLSQSWRQKWFPDRATFEDSFDKVESVVFIEGPNAVISGDTATVTGETQATLTGEIQHNKGAWYLVQEGGRWKIDGWTVNELSSRPA